MIAAMRAAVLLLLLVLPAAYNVMADAITPACMPPRDAVPVPFEHVPSVLLRPLSDRFGKVAEPGTSFNRTDVVWFESVPSPLQLLLDDRPQVGSSRLNAAASSTTIRFLSSILAGASGMLL